MNQDSFDLNDLEKFHTIIVSTDECELDFIVFLCTVLNMQITVENKKTGLIKLQRIMN